MLFPVTADLVLCRSCRLVLVAGLPRISSGLMLMTVVGCCERFLALRLCWICDAQLFYA